MSWRLGGLLGGFSPLMAKKVFLNQIPAARLALQVQNIE
jgi:hypothetical protein